MLILIKKINILIKLSFIKIDIKHFYLREYTLPLNLN